MRGAIPILLLAACGQGDVAAGNRGASTNQIERLSTPKVDAPDPSASARLRPLLPGDRIGGAPGSGLCDFSRGNDVFLVAAPADSVARIGDELLHLVHAAPYDETGGFFEDRRVSISVGRTAPPAGAPVDPLGQSARLVATNRRTRGQTRLDGVWRCDPLGREP
jgi:hypothetical protein